MNFEFAYLGFEYKGKPYLFDARIEMLQTRGGDYDSEWVEYENWRTDRQDGEIDVTMPDEVTVVIESDGTVRAEDIGAELHALTVEDATQFIFSDSMELLDEPQPDPART